MNIVIVPINARLIELSIRIAKPLIKDGHNITFAKTYTLGEETCCWDRHKNIPFKILNIDILCPKKKSNYFKYIYRAFIGYFYLHKYLPKNIDLFIVFHDSYADGEIFLKYAKRNKIKTLLLQEGFHSRVKKYDVSLYGMACYVRNIIFPFLFSKFVDGLNSDFVAVWSAFGMKADLVKMGANPERIYTVGNPFATLPINISEISFASNTQKTALIGHQPLWPRFATAEWEKNKYIAIIDSLLKNGYQVIFKTHPRFIKNKRVLDLINDLYEKFGKSNNNLIINNTLINSESLIHEINLFITFFSMTAYAFLKNNTPTVFIQPQFNAFSILEELAFSNKILYNDINTSLDFILSQISRTNINDNLPSNREIVDCLFGDNYEFDIYWPKAVNAIGKALQ